MKSDTTVYHSIRNDLFIFFLFASPVISGQQFEYKASDRPIDGVPLNKTQIHKAESLAQPALVLPSDAIRIPDDHKQKYEPRIKGTHSIEYTTGEFSDKTLVNKSPKKSLTPSMNDFRPSNSPEELNPNKGYTKIRMHLDELQKLPDKESGYVYLYSGTLNAGIPDDGWLCWHPTPTDVIPADATITEVLYSCLIDDTGDPSTFYCGDYEIWLSNATHGFCTEYQCVYDNLGTRTDGGYDDDGEDDSDIYLNFRSTSVFNGESPDQQWMFLVKDNWSGDAGMLVWAELIIYWETDITAPNLTSYTPSGWDAPIVVSSIPGTNTNGPSLAGGATTYFDWAVINTGADIPSGTIFYTYLYIDGTPVQGWYTDGLPSYFYAYVTDFEYIVSGGSHTVSLSADDTGLITESNESDNYYEVTPTWSGTTLPNLVADYTPSGWDYPIVLSSVTGTHTVGPDLVEEQPLYIDFAFINLDADITTGFYYDLFIDGSWETYGYMSSLGANYYVTVSDYMVTLTEGDHEICTVLDLDGFITESNEDDNEYCKIYTIASSGEPDIDIQPPNLVIDQSTKKQIEITELSELAREAVPDPHRLIDEKYIISRIQDPRNPDNEIVGVIVPGLPPKDYRAPVAVYSKAAVTLLNVPAFTWAFGCSATSAAMIAGYYDNTGFPDMYTGPTNGGVMPMDNSIWGTEDINGETRAHCPLSATSEGIDGRATKGHVEDYWVSYSSSAPDPFITNGWAEHTWEDCTADFMGTNQSNWGNVDGSTMFFYYTNGAPLYDYTGSEGSGNKDGCHGFRQFIESRGYSVTSNYTQLIYGYNGNTQGFTYDQYKAEIDAGRPVMIQVEGHTMLGYGYDNSSTTIYIHDTWDYSNHSMTWGGSYSGMQHYAVSVFEIEGGGCPGTDCFAIYNLGIGTLTITYVDDNKSWLTITGLPYVPFDIDSEGALPMCVNIDWDLVPGTSDVATIEVQSNDPDEPIYYVTVTANKSGLPPEAPTLVSPPNSATCQAVNLTFSWNNPGGATSYRLQVDNNSDLSSPYYDQSGLTATSQLVNGLNINTTYYWRVNATNSIGTSSWSSVWSFTTTMEAPGIPTLSSPGNGVTCQPSSLTLQWNAVSGASYYQLQLDDNSDFSSPEVDQSSIGGTSHAVSSLSAGATYYWRVKAYNACDVGSNWTTSWNFTVAPATPGTPSLSSPADGTTCQSVPVNLVWNTTSSASSYQLQVDNNSDFSSPFSDISGLTGTSQSISGLSEATTYYWRVKGFNSCNVGGSWSVSWSFTTVSDIPAAPVLNTPANGATCQPLNVVLGWNAVAGATSYHVQVDNNDDFSSPLINQEDIAGLTYTTSGLSEGTMYYWRVRAKDNCGNYGSWSTSRNFTSLEATPEQTVLASPANNAVCQALILTCSWNSTTGAATYQIQVDDDNSFTSPVVDESGITLTSYLVSGLNEGSIYYWRVKAINNCEGEGSWSSIWDFTTSAEIPGNVTLISPADNSGCLGTEVTCEWTPGVNTAASHLQIDNDPDFSSPVYDQDDLAGTSAIVSGLSEGSYYYWHVQGINACGAVGNWSPDWSFSTSGVSLETPILVGPENGSTLETSPVVLIWEPVASASEYTLQIDEQNDFGSPVVNQSGLSTTTFSISGLDNSDYYWKVKASNTDCTSESDWSEIWQFTYQSGIDEITDQLANGYYLGQNYPNPFHRITSIAFKIPVSEEVIFEILDINGRTISLYKNFYEAGENSITLDFEQGISNGVYFYRMKTLRYVETRVILIE
jgi:hypothetical protein